MRAARAGETQLGAERLVELFVAIEDWAIEDPRGGPDGSWSPLLADLETLFGAEERWSDWALYCSHTRGANLEAVGRREEALAVFAAAVERSPEALFSVYLHIEAGTYLRDAHHFARAGEQFASADSKLEQWRERAADETPDVQQNLTVFEALLASERGAMAQALMRSDEAQRAFRAADALALALEDADSASGIWAGNLMYWSMLLLERGDFRAADELEERFWSNPLRERLLPGAEEDLRLRFAMVDVQRALAVGEPAAEAEEEGGEQEGGHGGLSSS